MNSFRHPSKFTSLKLGVSLFAVIAFSLATASPAAAATARYGPIASTSPDSGTCGNDWADDTFQRVFMVNTTPTSAGVYRVREDFIHGSFVTRAGMSPGACNSLPNNGGMLTAGVTGRMGGSFTIVVSGGTYNATATCTAANCGTTAGFIAAVFGTAATYDVPTFSFRYVTHCNGEWINASTDRGGNRGDITGMAHVHMSGAHHCEHHADGDHHGDDDNGGNEGTDD